MKPTLPARLAIFLLLAACSSLQQQPATEFILSIIGTNDVHGEISSRPDRGGLTTISGYVNVLRAAREEDGGAVLLIDAGDMWQGTLDSNLNEGAAVVAAYNALGYTAAAIGNHEFDFGPVGQNAIPTEPGEDPRGALKQRASEAFFPLLAANLFDDATGAPVEWPNVRPSVLVDVNGLKVGIIGVMTSMAMQATIAANIVDLRVAPLVPVIENEARALRESGADLIVVTAHAGGKCTEFESRTDLSSCDLTGEIFRVANSLPKGLVNHIIAGHVHQGIAHIVNGTSITSSFSNTYAFSRVDFLIEKDTQRIVGRQVFQPHRALDGETYEGRIVNSDTTVAAIAARAAAFARERKQMRLGVQLDSEFTLDGNPESTLGNLFTDALLDSVDADIAIHNVGGGLRSNLAAGELTFGGVYELSPFDNRVVSIDLSGAELRKVVAKQAHRASRSMGFSGMRVFVSCEANDMSVRMLLSSGDEIRDDDTVKVIVNDYIAFGGDGILAPVMPAEGFEIDSNMPTTRDVFVAWLSERGGVLRTRDFDTSNSRKWNRPERLSPGCRLH